MQLQVKTILNAVQHFPGFVFQDIRLRRYRDGQPRHIEIVVEPHGGFLVFDSLCGRRRNEHSFESGGGIRIS